MASKKISELILNWDEIDGAAQRGASLDELCAIAGLNKEFFRRAVKHYKYLALARYMERMQHIGNYMVKQAQYDLAVVDKNPAMLRWLGIQRLGQRANVITEELNKALAGPPPDETPDGYEILSPKASAVIAAQNAIDVTPRPHDEKPAVAAIIEAEIVEGTPSSSDQPGAKKVISGHTGEEHEA